MKYEEEKVSKETEFMGVWNAIKKYMIAINHEFE